ncbi:MAG TPA: hypothetical protein DCG66_08320 [Brevundimonas sp.]|nr:hypothetical protein [Brevundimonas sp.]
MLEDAALDLLFGYLTLGITRLRQKRGERYVQCRTRMALQKGPDDAAFARPIRSGERDVENSRISRRLLQCSRIDAVWIGLVGGGEVDEL